MAIQFRCPSCQGLLSIATRRAGSLVLCPLCRQELQVPDPDQVDVHAAPRLLEEVRDEEDDEAVSIDEPLLHRRRTTDEEELDLTSMVDVVFQLLIFFMVTASFTLQKSIPSPATDPEKKGAAPSVQPLDELQDTAIVVRIDEANTVTIDDDPINDLSNLADQFSDRMRREQKTDLIIAPSIKTLHRTVITVIDAVNAAGVQRIRLAAPRGPD